MNILILNDYASIQGGAAQVAVTSARGLAQSGYRVTFVYAAGDSSPMLDHENITCISLGQFDLLNHPSRLKAAKSGLWNSDVEAKVDYLLKKYDPASTIIHIHSWVKALSVSAIACVLKHRFPVVLTLHDYFSICPNGGLFNYPKRSVCTLKPMSASCFISGCDGRSYPQKVWRYLRQAIYRHAGFPDVAIHYITVSDFSERLLRPHLPVGSRYWRIPNPIDVEKSDPACPQKSKKFTYIGRLSPEKGVLLLAQFKRVPQEQLRIIGSGELETDLKDMLPRAEFLGWCDGDKIMSCLEDTRALIFTSLLYETQGLVVGEAASRGVPSVVSDVTAASEFVLDGETGLLFASGDVDSLEQKLVKLGENDALVQCMGARAYERYWNNPPSLEEHVSRLIDLYNYIIKNY